MRKAWKNIPKKPYKKITALLFASAFFFLPCFSVPSRPRLETAAVAAKSEGYKSWEVISSYTTYFNKTETDRRENIEIAASLIDGVIVQPYGDFSFNQTVGRRTAEAGFKQAKIIVNGEYAVGVGGGVCQVSTTLYNAALKSGLTVTEFHAHSLQVSYVAPSRDAMVSTQSDLKFSNPHPFPVRLNAKAADGAVRVSFTGKKDGYRYEIVSETLGEIAPPPPVVKEGEEEKIVRSPKNGIKSEAYLECYEGDALVSRKRLRIDEYRAVQGIIVKKIGNTTD
ncbi:MAG: VanW family protein [Clostridia bacterium]|nr:VanW family protein [Clostridia bacterium]